jgi:hypothetical protein
MLSIHLRVSLPSGLFPSGFPTNNLYKFLFYGRVMHEVIVVSVLAWKIFIKLFIILYCSILFHIIY